MAAAAALPAVKTLADCTSYTLTVHPFLPQLRTFPVALYTILSTSLSSPTTLADLRDLYTSTNPLISGLAFALALAPIFLIVSEINRNYSQVDRVWSILPTVFNAHFAVWAHLANGAGIGGGGDGSFSTGRLDTLLAFSTVWSARLTFNYWRKGGYSIGSEDYRWELLRQKISPPLFFVFNVFFISLAQSLLLYSITFPTYVLLLTTRVAGSETPISDLVFSRLLVVVVLLEWMSDQQQWTFQEAKRRYKENGKVPPGYEAEDLERGFNIFGLWAWSRHPNFACEQAVWTIIYQWSCWVTDQYFNWSAIGAFSYIILFQASTWYTELVSAGKYPDYKEYQARVGMFLPRLSFATKEEEGKARVVGSGATKEGKGKGKAE